MESLKLMLQPRKLGELLINKGHLTQDSLQYALVRQESDRERLGRILIQQRLVSRRDLYRTLAQQWTLRCLFTALTFMISISAATGARAASSIQDVPGQIRLVSAANSAFAPMHNYPTLFGTEEKESTNISPFTKWTGMFERFEAALSEPGARDAVHKWQNQLRSAQGLPLKEMAQRVNEIMNARPYIEDNVNWGASDYWETPFEFLSRGGDCEDFAIAKYASLRMLGVPESRLRIAIVKDLQRGIPHAILILYDGSDALILDNQNAQVRAASMISRYQPIFSINREGWWLHKAPDSTEVASR
ncbi:MAG TPA: transglutaminase-like cysteine peptidase [Patescibacteria group bacterium]|jgi:predicted transglutaminase-like cysteine proteinase|nr:transglutaminase-like cysteine peptidase [Patescibacteria group bacterium]